MPGLVWALWIKVSCLYPDSNTDSSFIQGWRITVVTDYTISKARTMVEETKVREKRTNKGTKLKICLSGVQVHCGVYCFWNVMAHAQKPCFVFRRNGRVHLNRQGRRFSRLLAAEVCASAVVMLDTPCSEVVWRVLATHSIRQFPLHFPPVRQHVPSHFNWTLRMYTYAVPVICIWKHTRMVFSIISYLNVTIFCKSRRVLNLYVAGRLRPLARWDWEFEPRRGRGCLSRVSVVCLHVEVSALGWPCPLGAVAQWRKKNVVGQTALRCNCTYVLGY